MKRFLALRQFPTFYKQRKLLLEARSSAGTAAVSLVLAQQQGCGLSTQLQGERRALTGEQFPGKDSALVCGSVLVTDTHAQQVWQLDGRKELRFWD